MMPSSMSCNVIAGNIGKSQKTNQELIRCITLGPLFISSSLCLIHHRPTGWFWRRIPKLSLGQSFIGKSLRAGRLGEALWKAVSWEWHGPCSHGFTEAMLHAQDLHKISPVKIQVWGTTGSLSKAEWFLSGVGVALVIVLAMSKVNSFLGQRS